MMQKRKSGQPHKGWKAAARKKRAKLCKAWPRCRCIAQGRAGIDCSGFPAGEYSAIDALLHGP